MNSRARSRNIACSSCAAPVRDFTGRRWSIIITPTSGWCEDAWLMTAALTQLTTTFKYLVAFRPGFQSPFLAAQMAATYQRASNGRLLINVVVGGDQVEQLRYGDRARRRSATPAPPSS